MSPDSLLFQRGAKWGQACPSGATQHWSRKAPLPGSLSHRSALTAVSPSMMSGEYDSLGLSILLVPVSLSGRGDRAQGIRGKWAPFVLT